jgi:hypothetical protein
MLRTVLVHVLHGVGQTATAVAVIVAVSWTAELVHNRLYPRED